MDNINKYEPQSVSETAVATTTTKRRTITSNPYAGIFEFYNITPGCQKNEGKRGKKNRP